MAGRLPKSGLDFFGIETDIETDPKIKKLIRYGGAGAFTIYIWTLICTYRQGYYSTVEDVVNSIAWNFRDISEDTIIETLAKMAEYDLIDKRLYAENVITSTGIQKRCLQVFRKRTNIDCRYWLLDEFPPQKYNNSGNSDAEIGISSAEMQHRTEQNRTVKEQLKKRTVKENEMADIDDDFLQNSFSDDVLESLKEAGVDIKRNTMQWVNKIVTQFDRDLVMETIEDAIERHERGNVKNVVGYVNKILKDYENEERLKKESEMISTVN